MKSTKLIMLAFVYLAGTNCKAQHRINDSTSIDTQDSAVYNKLKSMDFAKYINNATVNHFLEDVGFKCKDSSLGFAPTSYLRYILYRYSDELWVEIQVNEFRHMNSWSPEHKWDIDAFKREKIGAIRFKYRGECVKCVGI